MSPRVRPLRLGLATLLLVRAVIVLPRMLENENFLAASNLGRRWANGLSACAWQILEYGHFMGDHAWDHKDLTKDTDSEIRQIIRAQSPFVSFLGCLQPLLSPWLQTALARSGASAGPENRIPVRVGGMHCHHRSAL